MSRRARLALLGTVLLLIGGTGRLALAGETLQAEGYRVRIPDGCVPASGEQVRAVQVAMEELTSLLPLKVRRQHALRVQRFPRVPGALLTIAALEVTGDLNGVAADALSALVLRNVEMRGGGEVLESTVRPINPGLSAHVAQGEFVSADGPSLMLMAMAAADGHLVLMALEAPEVAMAGLETQWQILLGSLRVGKESAAMPALGYERQIIVGAIGIALLLVVWVMARRRRRMRTVLYIEQLQRKQEFARQPGPTSAPKTALTLAAVTSTPAAASMPAATGAAVAPGRPAAAGRSATSPPAVRVSRAPVAPSVAAAAPQATGAGSRPTASVSAPPGPDAFHAAFDSLTAAPTASPGAPRRSVLASEHFKSEASPEEAKETEEASTPAESAPPATTTALPRSPLAQRRTPAPKSSTPGAPGGGGLRIQRNTDFLSGS